MCLNDEEKRRSEEGKRRKWEKVKRALFSPVLLFPVPRFPIHLSLLTMSFLDILQLALRNLRQAKLRAILTTMGVIVGVAVIVTMVSFGLGLQRNMLSRFKALDLF